MAVRTKIILKLLSADAQRSGRAALFRRHKNLAIIHEAFEQL
jgi:hypothetical protein